MSENIETVKKLYTAFGTGNLQGALDLMDGEINGRSLGRRPGPDRAAVPRTSRVSWRHWAPPRT